MFLGRMLDVFCVFSCYVVLNLFIIIIIIIIIIASVDH